MPTGYTAEILEGKNVSFKDFATKCMRAFGAVVHMRDESINTPYKKREVSSYYIDDLKNSESALIVIQNKSDKKILKQHIKELQDNFDHYKEQVNKINKNKSVLEILLKEANDYKLPSSEHSAFKKFMIDQLESTINYDGDDSYSKKYMDLYEEDLKGPFDVEAIRKTLIMDIEEDITYAKNHIKEEQEKVDSDNKWVNDIFKSLE